MTRQALAACGLILLCTAGPGAASATDNVAAGVTRADPAAEDAPLSHCRELRIRAPADALPRCEAAAAERAAARDFDAAFEAWMHAAESASQLGDRTRADAALEQAVPLLAQVRDPLAAHRLARRRGLNAYRDGQAVEALSRFLEALATARASGNTQAMAISENDLGVIHRHLGNHAVALGHLEASLGLRSARGETGLGALLANIGSLYLDLGDAASARRDLERALAEHRASGRTLHVHQTREELARVDEREGDIDAARNTLRDVLDQYLSLRAPRDALRVTLRLAGLEATHGAPEAARAWLEQARGLMGQDDTHERLQAELIGARLARTRPEPETAYAALYRERVSARGSHPAREAEADAALADLAEAMQQPQRALEHLREAHARSAALLESRHSERIDALRVRFDVARLESERDRLAAEAAQQEAELAQRRFETLLVGGGALLALALLALVMQSRLHRQRLRGEAERVALERRIVEARQAAALLRSDLRSSAWLLEQQHRSALVFDAAGLVRAVTAAAAQALGHSVAALQQQPLAAVLGEDVAAWAQALVESASLAGGAEGIELGQRMCRDGRLRLRCRTLDLEEELGVLLIEVVDAQAAPAPDLVAPQDAAAHAGARAPTPDEPIRETAAPSPGEHAADARQAFRSRLVELMQASMDAWERATRRTRVDLAEASGIWRITIDDGRLRVRALDRYLRADTLPERPRWREVLRTAYFVLSEVTLDAEQRARIEALVDEVLRMTRDRE